jgi:hypothetical protein
MQRQMTQSTVVSSESLRTLGPGSGVGLGKGLGVMSWCGGVVCVHASGIDVRFLEHAAVSSVFCASGAGGANGDGIG